MEKKKTLDNQYPELVEEMKKEMLQLRNEMVKEGGDWYSVN